MPKQPQDPLVSFMKKQMTKKVEKADVGDKNSIFQSAKKTIVKKDRENDEEMTEEEKVEEAKKESRSKVANQDTSEMYKKLFIETIVRYVLIIALLVGAMIVLIKIIPAAAAMVNGLFSKILLGSIK